MSTMVPTQRTIVRWGAGIGAVILVLLVAVWWTLSDTRDQGTAAAEADDLVLAQADEEDADESDQLSAAAIEVTYDVFLARDPFESIRPPEPVAADPEADPADPTATDPATNGTAPIGTTPSHPSAPDSKDPADAACVTGTEAVCDGIVVVLVDVDATSATVQVKGVSYAVAPGDQFAENFQLLRIDGDCVEVLYLNGDEAEVFRLCDGDVVAK